MKSIQKGAPARVVVFANPSAGSGLVLEKIHEAKRTLWGWDVEYIRPSSAADLTQRCASLDPALYRAAIVLGGDGTQNIAIRGLRRSGVPLFAFPAGTANDLSRELGVRADWEQAQYLIDSDRFEKIDLITVNDLPFATVAGLGVGASLTHELNEGRQGSRIFKELSKRMQGDLYTLLSAKTLLFGGGFAHDIHVRAEGFNEKLKTAALFVANQEKLGSDLKVASGCLNNDNKFSVMIIPTTRRDRLLRALLSLKSGKIPNDFIVFSTDHLSIREQDGKPIRVFGDGEILLEDPTLEFKVIPQCLPVYRERRRSLRPITAQGLRVINGGQKNKLEAVSNE